MIAAYLEPKGLSPDTPPLADYGPAGNHRENAVNGSIRLRNAIMRAQRRKRSRGQSKRITQQSWKVRLGNRRRVLELINVAADHFGIGVTDLTGSRGSQELSHRRQVAMYAAREIVRASYPDIGFCFGKRDHTTVLHGVRAIENRMQKDPGILAHVVAIGEVLEA
jgi:chromosomal replication initiator protein